MNDIKIYLILQDKYDMVVNTDEVVDNFDVLIENYQKHKTYTSWVKPVIEFRLSLSNIDIFAKLLDQSSLHQFILLTIAPDKYAALIGHSCLKIINNRLYIGSTTNYELEFIDGYGIEYHDQILEAYLGKSNSFVKRLFSSIFRK